jgi:hypothetical protein
MWNVKVTVSETEPFMQSKPDKYLPDVSGLVSGMLSIVSFYLCALVSILYSGSGLCTDHVAASTAVALLVAVSGTAIISIFLTRVGSSILDDIVRASDR